MKHLGAGSKDVPLEENSVRLYSNRFCPYAHRVHLVLNAKNIPHDIVYIDLKNKPEWYLDKVPTGQVPAINVDSKHVYESLIIADFINEKYPERPLHKPNDPLQKALDRLLIDRFAKMTRGLFKVFMSTSLDVSLLETVYNELDFFEEELRIRGTPFFLGEQPGMVDYMIWPWSERLDMIREMFGDQFKTPRDRFPRLLQWSKCMLEDPSVMKHYCTPQQHAKFFQSYKTGTTINYEEIFV